LTDWLNVTFPFGGKDSELNRFVKVLTEVTQGAFGGMTCRDRGLHGYLQSFAFDVGGVMFAFGGQRKTAFISFPSEACAYISDWPRFVQALQVTLGGRITRWDGAVDDFAGLHSVDLAVELYILGGFNSGGRRPGCGQNGNWVAPDGTGRTFYIGKRVNGKLLRVYEKGMQLGDPESPWVRWEVELHNVDRVVPWEAVTQPDRYVAGAYPCMSWVGAERTRIKTVRKQDTILYDRLTHVASIAYGALVNVMLEREGSAERVVTLLRRAGVPRRLEFSNDYLRRNNSDEV
jgi:phage replication initiation protein